MTNCSLCSGTGEIEQQRWQCKHFVSEWDDCEQCIEETTIAPLRAQAQDAHRTACTLMLAHLKSYASSARSGMPVDGILHLLEYNLRAIRDWTPETIAKAVAELEASQ